jgi:hypothetical protein
MMGQGLNTSGDFDEWKRAGKRPSFIPSAPWDIYTEDWKENGGLGGWLGSGNVRAGDEEFLSCGDAADLLIGLGVTSSKQFRDLCEAGERPDRIPSNPDQYYTKQGTWPGTWPKFLRTGERNAKGKSYVGLDELRSLVRKDGIISTSQYKKWPERIRRTDIPAAPDRYFKGKGWIDWYDLFGTERL